MKRIFCDICFKTKKIYRESTHKIWYKGNCETLRLDVCREHRNFFKDSKTYENAREKLRGLENKEV